LNNRCSQVFSNDNLNLIGFVHRQDVESWGIPGVDATIINGLVRLDYSSDEGATFNKDVGPLNPYNPRQAGGARYPQAVPYWPTGATPTVANMGLIWNCPVTRDGSWENYQRGYSRNLGSYGTAAGGRNPSNALNLPTKFGYLSTEQDQRTLIPGGLCEGRPGEFWMVDVSFWNSPSGAPAGSPSVNLDSLYIWKGVIVGTDSVAWRKYFVPRPRFSKGLVRGSGGIPPAPPIPDVPYPDITNWNMAFSPDGRFGWACFLTNLDTANSNSYIGQNNDLIPVLYKTTDGGNTWQGPIEIYLRNYNQIHHRILTRFIDADDTTRTVLSSGIPYPIDMDITVDANGNPHIFMSMINLSDSLGYIDKDNEIDSLWYVQFGGNKALFDVTSFDGGLTWNPLYISNINAVRGPEPGANVIWGSHLQVARNAAGTKIFYTWIDDTLTTDARSMQVNDLYGMAFDINTRTFTEIKNFSGDDATWSGKIYYPMTGQILTKDNGDYHIPVVFSDWQTNGSSPEGQVIFWTPRNTTFTNADFNQKNDLTIEMVESPRSVICSGNPSDSIAVTLRIKNTGSNVVDGFTVAFQRGNDAMIYKNYTATIVPNETVSITFDQKFAPLAIGSSVRFGAWVITNFDASSDNNEMQFPVTRIDAGSASLPEIFTPTEITNCGSLRLSVNPTYSGATLSWSSPDRSGFSANTPSIDITGSSAAGGDTYIVTADFGACGQKADTIKVKINAKATANILGPAAITNNTDATFTDNSTGATTYTRQWIITTDPGVSYTLVSGTLGDGSGTNGSSSITVKFSSTNPIGRGCVKLKTIAECEDEIETCSAILTNRDAIAAHTPAVAIYPNPTNGRFYLDYRSGLTNAEKVAVTILDATGRVVYNRSYSDVSGFVAEINLEAQPAGLYIMKLATDGAVVSRRIVKE
jgi:hypothetical protein